MGSEKRLRCVAVLWGKLKLNSLLVGGQVIVHHDHDLLVRDAVLVDDLVGMAHIGLGNGRKERGAQTETAARWFTRGRTERVAVETTVSGGRSQVNRCTSAKSLAPAGEDQ